MTYDKKILYALAATVTAGLLPIVLLVRRGSLPFAAAWLAIAAAATCLLVRKRKAPSINRKTVLLLTVVFILLYFTFFYLSGLGFGFVKRTVPFNLSILTSRVLPSTIIIVASEIIRRVLLSQERRGISVLAFTVCLLSELALAGGFGNIIGFSAFMDIMGLTFFPAISAGVLLHFLSARHGMAPAIAYRFLIAFIPLLVPISPAVPNALLSFVNLLLPLLLLLFLRTLFEKRIKRTSISPHAKRLGYIAIVLGLVFATGLIALISCRFRYGTVVIATGSMTGELNIGDAIIYEKYVGQTITQGDIIVFERDRSLVIHRVVEITHINDQTRYYTKGDANESRDTGYITSSNIVGITNFKISYIGYPSVWMHQIFENES
ncbi:MAG: signal peptidase I [Clostridia bacterium]|nr:signal peptidase I [Clostridia bacterium]MBQ3056749.1 signal peptidase I [Clostridia bacterium]